METLIELLQQIQDLAGAAIDALEGSAEGAPEGGEGEGAPAEGAPPEGAPPEGAPPAEGPGAGGPPPEDEANQG